MIVVGIVLVYFLRGRKSDKEFSRRACPPCEEDIDFPEHVEQARRLNGGALLAFFVLAFSGGVCLAEDPQEMDWSQWRKNARVLSRGAWRRWIPLRARTVEAICGRMEPTTLPERWNVENLFLPRVIVRLAGRAGTLGKTSRF